jgi:hypothetical protein
MPTLEELRRWSQRYWALGETARASAINDQIAALERHERDIKTVAIVCGHALVVNENSPAPSPVFNPSGWKRTCEEIEAFGKKEWPALNGLLGASDRHAYDDADAKIPAEWAKQNAFLEAHDRRQAAQDPKGGIADNLSPAWASSLATETMEEVAARQNLLAQAQLTGQQAILTADPRWVGQSPPRLPEYAPQAALPHTGIPLRPGVSKERPAGAHLIWWPDHLDVPYFRGRSGAEEWPTNGFTGGQIGWGSVNEPVIIPRRASVADSDTPPPPAPIDTVIGDLAAGRVVQKDWMRLGKALDQANADASGPRVKGFGHIVGRSPSGRAVLTGRND